MEKEAYLFAIYEILQSETDENNPLSASRIIQILEDRHNITIGIKKFYKAIRVLSGLFKISTYTENRKGYYLISRQIRSTSPLPCCAFHQFNDTDTYPESGGQAAHLPQQLREAGIQGVGLSHESQKCRE